MPIERSSNPNPYYQELSYWSETPTDYVWDVRASTHEELIAGVRRELSKLHKHLTKLMMEHELGKSSIQMPQLRQAIRETQEWLNRNDTPEGKLRGNWPRNVRPRLDEPADPSAGAGGAKNINAISNPDTVFRKFKQYRGRDKATIALSPRPDKKYVVSVDGRSIHFGSTLPDYTRHGDEARRKRYLKRAREIKGRWREDKYSANNLAINLLW